MINIANKTFSNYVENLNESDRKDLIKFLKTEDSELEPQFDSIKNEVKTKLTSLKEGTQDNDTLDRVEETITKVDSETYNKLSYFRLKNLNESL
jgi:ribosome recycling factor